MQIPLEGIEVEIKSYLVGLHEGDVTKIYIGEPPEINNLESIDSNGTPENEVLKDETHITNNKSIENVPSISSNENVKAEKKENDCKELRSKAIDIINAFSESSSDELSCSYSPSKCKGILKRFSSSRISRSISESSVDEIAWASSYESCYASMDKIIPENEEMSSSLKKTVRFKDVVSRQLFRLVIYLLCYLHLFVSN